MIMATGTLISEEEYLHTSYEPECEFEDGVLIERNVGTDRHSELQAMLAAYFIRHRKAWNIRVYTEMRFRVRPGKYLTPDIAVVENPGPAGPVFSAPPLVWIEILSPDDRHVRVNKKVQEVLAFGAPYVWVIDPETFESEVHTAAGHTVLADGVFRVLDSEIVVPLAQVMED